MAKINSTYSSGYYISPDTDFRKLEEQQQNKKKDLRKRGRDNEDDAEFVKANTKRQTFAIPFDLYCDSCEKRIARGAHVYTNRRATRIKYLNAIRIWELEIRCQYCSGNYFLHTDPETPKETGGYKCVRGCHRAEGDFLAINAKNEAAKAQWEREKAEAEANPLAALERENAASRQLAERNRQIEESVLARADYGNDGDDDLLASLRRRRTAAAAAAAVSSSSSSSFINSNNANTTTGFGGFASVTGGGSSVGKYTFDDDDDDVDGDNMGGVGGGGSSADGPGMRNSGGRSVGQMSAEERAAEEVAYHQFEADMEHQWQQAQRAAETEARMREAESSESSLSGSGGSGGPGLRVASSWFATPGGGDVGTNGDSSKQKKSGEEGVGPLATALAGFASGTGGLAAKKANTHKRNAFVVLPNDDDTSSDSEEEDRAPAPKAKSAPKKSKKSSLLSSMLADDDDGSCT